MVLIGELVKALNLYSNPRVAQNYNWRITPMLELHVKSFGCKMLNLIESFWYSPYASSLYSLWLFFFVFIGFALHNIHAFHSRLFLLFLFKKQNKNKKEEKGSKMCFALFFLNLKSRLATLSLHNMSMYLV